MKTTILLTISFFLLSISACSTSKKTDNSSRVEKMNLWVGPNQIEDRCFHPLAAPDCREKYYQIQKGKLDKNGAWETFRSHDFQIPNYEKGYIYRVKYNRVKLSKNELMADGPDYKVKNFEVVSRIKS